MNNRHLFLTSDGLTKNMKTSFFNIIGKRPEEGKYFIFQLLELKLMAQGKELPSACMNFY